MLAHKRAPVLSLMRGLVSSLAWLPCRVHPQVYLAWPGAANVVDHQVLHLDLRWAAREGTGKDGAKDGQGYLDFVLCWGASWIS